MTQRTVIRCDTNKMCTNSVLQIHRNLMPLMSTYIHMCGENWKFLKLDREHLQHCPADFYTAGCATENIGVLFLSIRCGMLKEQRI